MAVCHWQPWSQSAPRSRAPNSPYLHAKVILSTTEGLGGSANLSYHGLSINREMDAMVPASLLPAAWAWGEALWSKGTPAG